MDVFYLCNPNNPTGALIGSSLMGRVVAKCVEENITLVVDECFLDFVVGGVSFKEYLNVPELNLVVIKAFTKVYSMAGIRLGYALTSNPILCDSLANCGQAWGVSTVAQVCGLSALDCVEYIAKTKEYVRTEREYLSRELTAMGGFKVYPSETNYVLVKSYYPFDIYRAMLDRRILVRSCDNYLGLDSSYYRFAVKSHSDNLVLINALKRVCSKG